VQRLAHDFTSGHGPSGLGWPFVVDQGDVDVIGASPDAATVRAWLATRWTERGLSGWRSDADRRRALIRSRRRSTKGPRRREKKRSIE